MLILYGKATCISERFPIKFTKTSLVLNDFLRENPSVLENFLDNLRKKNLSTQKCSVADPDPGSGAFLTPGSGIPDLGSRIPDPKPIFLRAW